jgi:hypothetical protein
MAHEITHEQLKQTPTRKDREVVVVEETIAVPAVVSSTTSSCIGRPWTEPPTPCQGGPKSHETKGILFNGKREIACKECFNARERFKAQQKKLKKDDDN